MDKRGVYFFVIDAFLGGAIILLGLIIIFNSYSGSAESDRPFSLLEDFTTYMQSTEVRDFQDETVQDWISNGTIQNPENTLFEQVAVFHSQGNMSNAATLVEEVIDSSLPSQMNVRYEYNGTLIYMRNRLPREQASLMLSSKKVSMVNLNTTDVYGPHLVEVMIWIS